MLWQLKETLSVNSTSLIHKQTLWYSVHIFTLEGESKGNDIPDDFAGDVTGVFLGDTLGDVVKGSSSFPKREGGGISVHEGALGPPITTDP